MVVVVVVAVVAQLQLPLLLSFSLLFMLILCVFLVPCSLLAAADALMDSMKQKLSWFPFLSLSLCVCRVVLRLADMASCNYALNNSVENAV